MDKVTSVLAALDAGKLPSQQQASQFINWIQTSWIPSLQPSGSDELSAQGRLLATDIGQVLEAYKQLGSKKNGDNTLQQAIWHLSEGDLSSTELDIVDNTKEASADAEAIRSSLRTLIQIIWTSISSEGSSVMNDFASFMRLTLADAVEVIEAQAGKAKEGLRNVEDEVQGGERDNLGRKKKSDEENGQDQDVKIRFEKGMDTIKGAGSTVIGVGQSATAKAEELSDKTTSRFQNAWVKICDRAQNDSDYHSAVTTIFTIVQKWLTRSIDTAADDSTTLASFIHDPTPEQHILKALHLIRTLVERLSGNQSLEAVLSRLRACVVDVRTDKDLQAWFETFFAYLRKSLDEAGYLHSEEAKQKRKELRMGWKALQDQESDTGRKWARDFGEFKAEVRAVLERIDADEDLQYLRDASGKLGKDLEGGLEETAETGLQAAIERVSWFWQDLFKVYAPKALSLLKDIPIPRTEYKDADIELVLENLDISSFDLLPSHIYIRNITDVDITTSATSSQTAIGTLTRIRIQALQLSLKDVSFWFKDKRATIGPSEYTGLLACTLPPKGIDIDLKVRLIPATPAGAGTGEREARKAFHVVEHVEVGIAEDLVLDVRESNHAVLLSLFKPIFTMRMRDALERALTDEVRALIEGGDGIAWDVGERAEVFADAGMGRGAAVVAAAWSELGRLRRLHRGVAWRATGTGIVREERGQASFAVGAEPQILSGDKRGPMGTFSEDLKEVARETAEEAEVDVDMNVDTKHVAVEAKKVAHEGKELIRSFRRSVEIKAEKERRQDGWESGAFDIAD